MSKKNTHLNDKTIKYQSMTQAQRQHEYLGLPGTFKTRYPQEIVFPYMESGRMDECYSTEEGLLIDLEEESEDVNEKTLQKFGKYGVFGSYMYPLNMYIAVIVHKDPKNFKTFFKKESSIYIKIHYIYFADKELWEKYENVINKIKQKKQLTDTEALDMAFIAKFISKEYSYHVVKTLSANFKNAIIPDRKLKIDVGVILGAMILKHVENENEQDKLMEKINMKQIEKEIHKIVYDEYGDVLDAKDKEIAKLNNEKKEYKKSLQKLKEMEDLNPEAKKIINSLILL